MVDNRCKSSKIYIRKGEIFSPFFSIIVQNSTLLTGTSALSPFLDKYDSLLSAKQAESLRTDNR